MNSLLAADVYDDKGIKKYVKNQLKLIKKNSSALSSELLYEELIKRIKEIHDAVTSNVRDCIIRLNGSVDVDDAKNEIREIIKEVYQNVDTRLLFKIVSAGNEIYIRRKIK